LELQKQFPEKVNESCDLYLWGHWWCCESCWNKMIEINIRNIYLLKDSEILFNTNNSKNIQPDNLTKNSINAIL